MSRKRSLKHDAEAGDVMVLDSSSNSSRRPAPHEQQEQQHTTTKRACGTTHGRPAPGQLSSAEVATYLHSLSSHLHSGQLERAGQLLSSEGWQAFAELNILLGRFLSTDALPAGLLRGYHSFTLQPRAQLWQVYSSYAAGRQQRQQQQQQEAQDEPRQQQYAQQLQLVLFLLEWVLAAYPDCSLTEVKLQLPPWMVSWASRWGVSSCSSNSLSLICLEAYGPLDPGTSSAATARRSPARKLFVPALL